MGQQVSKPVWVADDGKEFATQADMLQHEAQQQVGGLVDMFLDSLDLSHLSDRGAKAQETAFASKAGIGFDWLRQNGYLTPAAVEASRARQAEIEAEKAAAKEAAKAAKKAAKAAEEAAQAAPAPASGASPFPGMQPPPAAGQPQGVAAGMA